MEPLAPHAGDPERLEALYRADPVGFAAALPAASRELPDSLVLRAWAARLAADPGRTAAGPAEPAARARALRWLLALSFGTWALVQGPAFGGDDFMEWTYTRFGPLLALALVGVFLLRDRAGSRAPVVFLAAAGLLALATGVHGPGDDSDTAVLALMHAPLALASFLLVAFAGDRWREARERLAFLRFTGEAAINAVLVLLGGIVLTVLCLGLFHVIGIDADQPFLQRVVPAGLILAPLFGAYVQDVLLRRESRLAAILSAIFIPLFLLLAVAYLVGMFGRGADPFRDREFLVALNGLMLVVWAMTVFSVAHGAGPVGRLQGALRVALVLTTLAVNVVAVAAFVSRTIDSGLTPNRVSALGANLLVSAHLVLILVAIARSRRDPSGTAAGEAVARFLPAYGAWALVNVVVLPLVFG